MPKTIVLNSLKDIACTKPESGVDIVWRYPDLMHRDERTLFERHAEECPACRQWSLFSIWLSQNAKDVGQDMLIDCLIQKAAQVMDMGDYERASALLERLLIIVPHHPDGLFNLGLCKARRGLQADARRIWEMTLKHYPQHCFAMSLLGYLHYQEGDYEDATKLLEDSIALYSDDERPYVYLAMTKLKLDDPENAIPLLQKAIEINPDSPGLHGTFVVAQLMHATVLRKAGAKQEAAKAFEGALNYYPELDQAESENLDILYNLGVYRTVSDEQDEARIVWEKILNREPRHAQALVQMSGFFLRQERPREAMDFLERAKRIEFSYDKELLHNNLGICHERNGDMEAAGREYEKAIDINPEALAPLINLGRICQRFSQIDKALSVFSKAITIAPDSAEANVALGVCLMERGDYERGLQYLDSADRIKPNHWTTLSYIGQYHMETGEPGKGAEFFLRAVQAASTTAEARFNLGNAYYALKKDKKAAAAYREATEINTQFPEALNNLGLSLERLGQLDEARIAFEDAIRVNPNDAGTLSNLAVCLHLQGDQESAQAVLEKAYELAASHSDIRTNLERMKRYINVSLGQGTGERDFGLFEFTRILPAIEAMVA